MALSQSDLSDLHAIMQAQPELAPGYSSSTPFQNQGNSPGFVSRLGMGLANVPTQAVHDIGQNISSLANMGIPEGIQGVPSVPTFNPFTVPQAKTTSDAVADVIPGIASLAASIVIPEMGIAKFLQGAGMEATSAKLLAAGAGWGLSGANEGSGEAAAQAGQGVAFQALGGMPMKVRAPMAAGLGLATGAYYGVKDGAQQGLTMGGANALMGLIGHGAPKALDEIKPPALPIDLPPPPLSQAPIQAFIDSSFGAGNKSAAESASVMGMPSKSAADSASIINPPAHPDSLPTGVLDSSAVPITGIDHLQPLQNYVDPNVKFAGDSASVIMGAERPFPAFDINNPNPAPITPDSKNSLESLNAALGQVEETSGKKLQDARAKAILTGGDPDVVPNLGRKGENGSKLYSDIPDFSALKTLTGQDLITGGAGAMIGGYNDQEDPMTGAALGFAGGVAGSKALRFALELKGGMAKPLQESAVKAADDETAHLQSLQNPVKLASEESVKVNPSLSELPKAPDYRKGSEAGYMLPALGARIAVGGLTGAAIGGASSSDHDTAVRNALIGGMVGAAALSVGPEIAKTVTDALVNHTFELPKVPSLQSIVEKNFSKEVVDSAGRAYTADGSSGARLIREAQKKGLFGLPPTIRTLIREGRGDAGWFLSNADNAWKGLKYAKDMPKGFEEHLNAYLNGGEASDLLKRAQEAGGSAGQFAQAAIVSRQSIEGLQNMIVSGLKDGEQKDMILKSIGARNYLTQTYSIFNPKKAITPKQQEAMLKVAQEMQEKSTAFKGMSTENVLQYLQNYVKDIKENKVLYGSGEKDMAIGQQAFKPRKELSQAWNDFLGEVTNPRDRISQTLARLKPMAESAHFMHSIVSMGKDAEGMPHYFATIAERDGMISKLQNEMSKLKPEDSDYKKMDTQISKLKQFTLLDEDKRYGVLAGGMVSTAVKDQLQDFNSAMTPTSALGRATSWINKMTKLSHTAYNPLTKVRDYITTPLFLLAARSHNPADWVEGIKVMQQGAEHPLYEAAIRNGILNVDQMHSELGMGSHIGNVLDMPQLDLTKLNMGKLDMNMAMNALHNVHEKVLQIASGPDNIIRMGSWISARAREAKKLGLDIAESGHWNAETLEQVNRAAADHVDRYTFNYRDTNKLVKGLRDKPFVNLYVTYVSEIARIAKNLVTDAVHPDTDIATRLHAMGTLATFAAMPSLIQSQAESSLSEKDKHDWDQAKSLMPDYGRTRFYAGIKRIGSSNQFSYVDYSTLIPHDMFAQLARAVAQGDWKAAAAVNPVAGFDNTPALNIARTLSTGKNLHTQRQMRGTADYVTAIAQDLLPPQFPGIGSEAQKIAGAFTKNDQGQMGVMNTRTGRKFTPEDILMSYTTGLRPTTVNLDVERKNFVSEAKQHIANEKSYLLDVQGTDLPQDVKDKATDRYKLSVANILARVHQKLSPEEVEASPQ